MKEVLEWLNDALASKEQGGAGMTYYRVKKGVMSATDGQLTAAAPWAFGGEFLAPGAEFEKVLKRVPGEPKLSVEKDCVKLRSGRFSGTIQTLPLTEWDYPGCEDAKWKPLPKGLLDLLGALRPFILDDAAQAWAKCVAIQDGWCFATNNIAIAGAQCAGIEKIKALLPIWALDFVLKRADGVTHWAWTDHYAAFKWDNGAWMRSQLIVGEFPEKAAQMVRASVKEKPSYAITDEFREAFCRVADLAEDTLLVYADCIRSRFGKAVVEEGIKCKVPKGQEASIWGARFLVPALNAADAWSPEMWPNPAPFKGKLVSGYIVGRRA